MILSKSARSAKSINGPYWLIRTSNIFFDFLCLGGGVECKENVTLLNRIESIKVKIILQVILVILLLISVSNTAYFFDILFAGGKLFPR